MSYADIKLDRQRKRNEAAEASLSTGPPLERRQASRTNRKWKPFDLNSDAGGGVPIETRVNTYSRASSTSRPVSALSHRTDESIISDASGFQPFAAGRKGRRNDLRSRGAEKQQTTVEASFDAREIYEVFGNALPGPEYLMQNRGFKEGQVQFLQHPNGDISAQQWASARFEWVNIGQFSNIRKKVEGQLASDRLKGEMAFHTLHQNTLQYFRTIAKQREAVVMGLAFGPKEIEASMPAASLTQPTKAEPEGRSDSYVSLSTMPTNIETKPQIMPKHEPPKDVATPAAQRNVHAPEVQQVPAHQVPRSPLPPNVPKEPRVQRWEITGPEGGAYAGDPFYLPQTSTQTSYPHQSYNTSAHYQSSAPPNYGYQNMAQTPYRVPQGYNFPPVAVPNQTLQSPGAQRYFADRAAMTDKMQSLGRQVYGNQGHMQAAYGQGMPSYPRTSIPDIKHTPPYGKPYEAANEREILAPQPKPISSYDRSAMRHTLYKLGESARERNHSQANIRTVLHDPFQRPSAPELQKTGPASAQQVRPSFSTKASDSAKVTQSSPLRRVRNKRKDILQQSSPDTQWTKRPYEHSTPLLTKSSAIKPASQPITKTDDATQGAHVGRKQGNGAKTYEEWLDDWWKNGSTFARQEELHKAIMATQAADSKVHSPPAHLTPIGPPSRNNAAEPPTTTVNETTTRLLIPVWENLACYVDGPKTRDYWCPWGPAPEWCIDRSPEGNKSFFEADWGSPPQRVGRDPRYGNWSGEVRKTSSGYGDAGAVGGGWKGVDRRFAHAGGL